MNGQRFFIVGYVQSARPFRTDTPHWQAVSTGQLNTILTFYEVQYPELPSELSDIPTTLLRRAIDVLRKTNRAQIIESAEGGGVRFFGGG
jgi:ESCRT-II complex subunit VPS25